MRAMSSLIKNLESKFPDITFAEGPRAHWSPDTQTVYYNPKEQHADWVLLHETSHAALNHHRYVRDIELLDIEREAWNYAVEQLAPQCSLAIDPTFIETQLDTYRDWIHSKSTCPHCQSNGFERQKHSYCCPHCGSSWQTNIGIDVGIRRVISSQ